MIKVRFLRWRVCPALYGWTQYNHRGPCAEKIQESQEKEVGCGEKDSYVSGHLKGTTGF